MPKRKKPAQSAKTGRFVSKAHARRHPATTINEPRKRKKKRTKRKASRSRN